MKIKFYFTCIFLCGLFFPTKGSGTFKLADSLYLSGQFYDAAIEYERVIYQNIGIVHSNHARYRKALSLKQIGNYSKALGSLKEIQYWAVPDSLTFPYFYETALCAYLHGSFMETEKALSNLLHWNNLTLEEKRCLHALLVLAYNEMGKYDSGYKSFTQLIDILPITGIERENAQQIIDQVYARKNLPRLKKEKTQEVLNYLPGLGHVYAGNWKEGLLSFSLNLSSLAFGAYQVYLGYYITGYFGGAIPLNKFYFGSRTRAAFLLEKYNYEEKRRFNKQVKDVLLRMDISF